VTCGGRGLLAIPVVAGSWAGGRAATNAAPRGSFPSEEIPNPFRDRTALTLHLPHQGQFIGGCWVPPILPLLLIPPAASPASSFVRAPEAPGEPISPSSTPSFSPKEGCSVAEEEEDASAAPLWRLLAEPGDRLGEPSFPLRLLRRLLFLPFSFYPLEPSSPRCQDKCHSGRRGCAGRGCPGRREQGGKARGGK